MQDNIERFPHPRLPYSQAVRLGDTLYIAGQPGINLQTGEIPTDFEAQARLCFENMRTVLESAGSSMDRVVKTVVYLVDGSKFDLINQLYAEYFPGSPPTRSVPVIGLPRKEFLISIEAVAAAADG